ncbi:MAG: antibiotic biosynthesis monooxygenase [Oceanobacter sp.]|jgi:heme-degrading monooxygenase HmoA
MIKVLIDRQIAEGMESTYEEAIKQTLSAIVSAQGYVSGASYKDCSDSNRRIIITNWRTLEDWQRWNHSLERKNVIASIQPILMREERFTILSA